MEQEIKTSVQEIIIRLTKLQEDMNFLREQIDDINLTEDDIKSIEEAERDLIEGKTISLEDLKNVLITSQTQHY